MFAASLARLARISCVGGPAAAAPPALVPALFPLRAGAASVHRAPRGKRAALPVPPHGGTGGGVGGALPAEQGVGGVTADDEAAPAVDDDSRAHEATRPPRSSCRDRMAYGELHTGTRTPKVQLEQHATPHRSADRSQGVLATTPPGYHAAPHTRPRTARGVVWRTSLEHIQYIPPRPRTAMLEELHSHAIFTTTVAQWSHGVRTAATLPQCDPFKIRAFCDASMLRLEAWVCEEPVRAEYRSRYNASVLYTTEYCTAWRVLALMFAGNGALALRTAHQASLLRVDERRLPSLAQALEEGDCAVLTKAWAELCDSSAEDATLRRTKEAILDIYTRFNPAKVCDVPKLLGKYVGKEASLLRAIKAKYKVG